MDTRIICMKLYGLASGKKMKAIATSVQIIARARI
jgi:hypothetical protein